MNGDYVSPLINGDAFNCPRCGAFAHQEWYKATAQGDGSGRSYEGSGLFSFCARCAGFALWFDGRMILPSTGSAPQPHTDLPEDVRADYKEAASIVAQSPRGAAALLRLSIQKLCIHLGGKGKALNEDIGELVKAGLPVRIQQSLDVVRVIGNSAVHPGIIDVNDSPEIAQNLFGLVNVICEIMVTQPKHIEALYSALPETARAQIDRRDS